MTCGPLRIRLDLPLSQLQYNQIRSATQDLSNILIGTAKITRPCPSIQVPGSRSPGNDKGSVKHDLAAQSCIYINGCARRVPSQPFPSLSHFSRPGPPFFSFKGSYSFPRFLVLLEAGLPIMQLTFSFSLLLATLLLTVSSGVQAAPARRGGMVTLPLKRIPQARDDIHPQVVSYPL